MCNADQQPWLSASSRAPRLCSSSKSCIEAPSCNWCITIRSSRVNVGPAIEQEGGCLCLALPHGTMQGGAEKLVHGIDFRSGVKQAVKYANVALFGRDIERGFCTH